MFLQQELWLIIVGLITAFAFKRTTTTTAPFSKIALWASIFAIVIGELGMLSTLFFPSDLTGFIVTTFAALMGARFGAKRGGHLLGKQPPSSRKRKK